MALEQEPLIRDPPAAHTETVFPTDPNATMAADAAKKAKMEKRKKDKALSSSFKASSSSSRKDKDLRKLIRPGLKITAHRAKASPQKRSLKLIREESDTEEVIEEDPALNEQGLPARKLMRNEQDPLAHGAINDQELLFAEQHFDVKSDEDYPLERPSPKAKLIFPLKKDILRNIVDRGDYAHFNHGEVDATAELFFDCGLSYISELKKKTRSLNRTFMLEDLRSSGNSAKTLRLFTALLATFPPPTNRTRGRRANLPNVVYRSSLSPLKLICRPFHHSFLPIRRWPMRSPNRSPTENPVIQLMFLTR